MTDFEWKWNPWDSELGKKREETYRGLDLAREVAMTDFEWKWNPWDSELGKKREETNGK